MGSGQTRATNHTQHFASSFLLAAVYGWDDSQREGVPFHHVSRPRIVACSRASRFPPSQNSTRGVPNTARNLPVREESIVTRAYIKMQEPRLSRTLHAPAAHTGTPTCL